MIRPSRLRSRASIRTRPFEEDRAGPGAPDRALRPGGCPRYACFSGRHRRSLRGLLRRDCSVRCGLLDQSQRQPSALFPRTARSSLPFPAARLQAEFARSSAPPCVRATWGIDMPRLKGFPFRPSRGPIACVNCLNRPWPDVPVVDGRPYGRGRARSVPFRPARSSTCRRLADGSEGACVSKTLTSGCRHSRHRFGFQAGTCPFWPSWLDEKGVAPYIVGVSANTAQRQRGREPDHDRPRAPHQRLRFLLERIGIERARQAAWSFRAHLCRAEDGVCRLLLRLLLHHTRDQASSRGRKPGRPHEECVGPLVRRVFHLEGR